MTAQPIRRNNARAKPAPKLLFTLKTKAKTKQLKPDSRTGLPLRIHRAADKIDKSRGCSFWILMVSIFRKRSIVFYWQQPRSHDQRVLLATAWTPLRGCPECGG